MKVKKSWIVLATAFVVWTAVAGFAAYTLGLIHGTRFVMREDEMLIEFRVFEQCGFTLSDFGLQEGQWQKFRAVGYSARPELDALKERIRENKLHLLQLLHGPADTAAVQTNLNEIAEPQSEFEHKMVGYILRLRELLTDRQLPKFDKQVRRAVCPWL